MQRTISIETTKKIGETVKLNGWVHVRRIWVKLHLLSI